MPNGRRIGSVSNALRVLRLLAASPEGIGVTELALRMGIGKSTAHLLLQTLAADDFVVQRPDARYQLGMGALEVGAAAGGVAATGGPLTEELHALADASSEAVSLAAASGQDAIIIQRVESASVLRAEIQVGTRMPLHASASGKLLLAQMPLERVLRLFPDEHLPGVTDHTLENRAELLDQLEEVRRRGYAWNDDEYTEGVSGVAAGVRDATGSTVFALSIAGPTHRFVPQQWIDELRASADRMTAVLLRLGPAVAYPAGCGVAVTSGAGARS